MRETWCRPQFTIDEHAWHEVIVDNTYELPANLGGKSRIIDIGGHIGCFSLACLARGAGFVLAVEADPRNYLKLQANLSQFPKRAEVLHAAVLQRDGRPATIGIQGYDDNDPNTNTGGGSVITPVAVQTGGGIPTTCLDDLIERVGGVRLVKIDAEGSEYPILYGSARLNEVQEFVMEVHHHIPVDASLSLSPEQCTVTALASFLKFKGFKVRFERHPMVTTLFSLWAKR